MRFANATNLDRKSGGAKPRDLQFRGPFLEMFFDRARVIASVEEIGRVPHVRNSVRGTKTKGEVQRTFFPN